MDSWAAKKANQMHNFLILTILITWIYSHMFAVGDVYVVHIHCEFN